MSEFTLGGIDRNDSIMAAHLRGSDYFDCSKCGESVHEFELSPDFTNENVCGACAKALIEEDDEA